MLSLFNTTKIDKMQLSYKRNAIAPITRETIAKELKKNFPSGKSSPKECYILNRFTPTRMKRGNIEAAHNLQMPPEHAFKKALRDISLSNRRLAESIKDTKIHLTKDILLESSVQFYLEILNNKPYSRLEAKPIGSDERIYGLYLYYNREIDSESSRKFCIKFYDKVAEYYKEHETYICQLYEPLTPEDKRKLGKHYNEKTNTVNLEGLNWLRIEIELHESVKILPITRAISNKADVLTLAMILDCENFYEVVENVFTNTLKKLVFSADDSKGYVLEGLAEIQKLAYKLCGYGDGFYTLKAISKELGLESQFSEFASIARKLKPESQLYEELEQVLFTKSAPRMLTQVGRAPDNDFLYIPRLYKEHTLIYPVPILDDS